MTPQPGDSGGGGSSSSVSSSLTSGVTQIFSNDSAFAALKSDGSVVTWGYSFYGGDSSSVSSQLTSGVVSFADPFNDDRLVPLSTTPTTPTITLAVNPSSVTEDGTTNLVYTLTRTGDLANSLIVNVNGGGTAVLDTDFSISGPIGQSTSGSIASVTFAAGSSTATVIVDPIPNSIPGGNKTVFATLAPGVGYNIGTVGAVTGTILEDDVVAPTLAIASTGATQTEGNSGTKAFPFTVTRSGDTTSSSSANWAVTGFGTNQADVTDFGGTLPTGTVNFTAGETSKTIIVDVLGDTTVEPDEGFTVTLSNPTNATITTATAVGTIQNDDVVVAPGLAIAPTNAIQTEGNIGTKAFTFTVTRSGDTTGSSSANWAVTGSGTNPADVTDFGGTLPTGTVNFTAGETSKTIIVDVLGDTTVEPDEGFTVTLSNPTNATITTATAVGTIQNDDVVVAPGLAIAPTNAIQTEGNLGTKAFTFTVTRSGDTTGSSSANWAVTGSSTNQADVTDFGGTLPSGMVSFAAGETSQIITVNVSGDTTFEPDEGFTVTLSNPIGAVLGTSSVGTNIRESASGGYGVTEKFYNISSGDGIFKLNYNMYAIPDKAEILVNNVLQNQTNGFVSGGGSLDLNSVKLKAGDQVKVIITGNVQGTAWDYSVDYSGGISSLNYIASGVIINDDTQVTQVNLAVSPTTVTEDGNNNLIYTFTRTGSITNTLAVNYTIGGTATLDTDYTGIISAGTTKTVTFAAGSSTATVTIDPIADTTVEGDETVELTLAPGTGYNIDTTSVVTGTITNDDRTLTPITNYAPNVNISTGLVFSTNGGGNLSLDTNRLSMSNEVTGVQNGTKSNFNHLFGLYEVVDADGGINTGSGIVKPGDRDYAFHALTTARVKDFIVQAGNSDIPSTATQLGSGVSLQGNKFYAPFVIANCGTYFPNLQQGVEDFVAAENGDVNRFANAPKHVRDLVATEVDNEFNNAPRFVQEPVAYFSFGSANPDKSPHLRSYGNGVYGFEDLPATATQYSNNDFNDAVFALS
ncbi:Calx-beta domain-containing protein [Cylindrospermopsis raciborskii DSH]